MKVIEDYQRKRLKEVARTTVDKELCLILRMFRKSGIRLERPEGKKGKKERN